MKNLLFFCAAFLIFFSGCKKDETGNLVLNISGLEDLGADARYEGWLIVDGSPVTTGIFAVDADGNLSQTSFPIENSDLESATKFVLTIEPFPDADPAPTATHILGGDFSGNSAGITVDHETALGVSFSSSTGKYILATPTTTVTTDENSGVWFLDLASGMPAVGLDLPTLPAGWNYEGWAVIDGTPVTTGTFRSLTTVDDADTFSGANPGPPFPGEDFVGNAPSGLSFPTNLAGGTMVISIEPAVDNSPAPFGLKPLVGMVPTDAADHFTYDMDNNASSFPTGTVTR